MDLNKKTYVIYLEDDGADICMDGSEITSHAQSRYIVTERRRIMRGIYTCINSSFCKKHSIIPIHSSRYCGCVIAELEDGEVEKIKKDTNVKSVDRFEEKYLVPHQTDTVSVQIRTDSIRGSHSADFDGKLDGYLGDYVTVGAVSAQNLTYIPDALQLREPLREGRLMTISEPSTELRESVHSSVVASIIVGGETQKNGVIYRGSAPLSRLYIAPSDGVDSMLEAIEKCIDNGAVIINYSAGEYFSDGKYDSFDKFVDTLIYNVRFLFTVSAGNSKYVSSPGTCMNGITVGNAATKINGYTAAKKPYNMFFVSDDDCSAYEHDEALPSKPDIAAPGTYIHYIDSYGNIDFSRYGTSFSAPYVSAVAAQLVQKYPNASIAPALLKALILCGADGDGISKTGNPQNGEGNILRLKSGAGFLDSVGALQITDSFGGSIGDTNEIKRDIFLNSGQRIRVVLCYLRDPDISAFSPSKENVVLYIVSPDKMTVSVSDDDKENVKLIDYTADASGMYELYFKALSLGNSNTVSYGIAWRIC